MPFTSNTPIHLRPSIVVKLQSSARLDFVIGIIVTILLISLTLYSDFDAMERLYEFTRAHEEWEVDEIIISFFWVGIGSIIYGIRRMRDIKTLNKQIFKHAYYDPITKLPNRILALDRLDKQLLRVNRYGGEVVVAFLDFNNFKAVNDRFGHNAGDELIKQVGSRLSKVVRDDETVARLGGDEFLIVATFLNNSDTEIERLLSRVIKTQQQPHTINGIEINVRYSVGVAKSSSQLSTSIEIIKAADIAMYKAKSLGASAPYVFYSQGMTLAASKEKELYAEEL